MKIKEWGIALLFLFICAIFFYKTVLSGYIPFPGDLLVGNYEPYKSQSFLGYLPGSVPHKAQGPDVIKELFPWKYFAIDSLKHGEIPFWDPHNFSGNNLMANFQTGVFYPFNALFFLLSFPVAWTIFIFLIPFLTIVWMYLFLREFSLDKISSIFGGIVFAFSSYMVVWMEYGNIGHTLLWLPLALYLTEKILQRNSAKRIFLLVLVLTTSFLAGYIQGYFYMLVVLAFYFYMRKDMIKGSSFKKSVVFYVALLFPFLLSLYQLLPTVKLFAMSSRGNYSLDQIQHLLNPIWYMVTTVVPDFFGNPAARNHWFYGTYIERVSYFGVIPLIFSLYGIMQIRKRREVKIFTIIFILSWLLSVDLLITKFFYLLPLPLISTTVPTRILSMFVFSGSILAAFGLSYFQQLNDKKNIVRILGIISVVIVMGWVFVFFGKTISILQVTPENIAVTKHNLILPMFYLVLLSFLILLSFYVKKYKKIFIIAIIVVTIFDLFYFFQRITPFSPQQFIYPQTPVVSYLQQHAGINRFWGYGSAYIESNFQTYDKTFSPEGSDPLHIKSYTEFLAASKDGKVPSSLPRPDANLAPGYGTADLKSNLYRQKELNILGIKYILHKNPIQEADLSTFDQQKYQLVWQQDDWQVYENKQVAPRFFLTDNYVVISKKEDVLRKFFSEDFNEKKTIILNQQPSVTKGTLSGASARLLKYSPNNIIIDTNVNAEALLFLSDTYDSSWNANIDGVPAKIYIADYTFRAVAVPVGKHRIEFSYNGQAFNLGLTLSGIFAAIFFIFVWQFKKFKI